jgi:hypothetical protein
MKTKFIYHRVNSLSQAATVQRISGAEIDLRLSFGEVIVAHDPYELGCTFTDWLKVFSGDFVVLNLKEMGIEEIVLTKLQSQRPELDYFFLDLIMPNLLKSLALGINCAARVSEFESTDIIQKINAPWYWLDSFSGKWDYLKRIDGEFDPKNKKFCLVSPELQGRNLENGSEFREILKVLDNLCIPLNAVCTKNPKFWQSVL